MNTHEKKTQPEKTLKVRQALSHDAISESERHLAMAIDQFRRMDNAANEKTSGETAKNSNSDKNNEPVMSAEERNAAMLALLKNPDTFTPHCRGGFASGGEIYQAVCGTTIDTFPFLKPRSARSE